MKRCPQCKRVETDASLSFCRTDGTSLVNDFSSIDDEAGTVRLSPMSTEPATTVPSVPRGTGPTTVLTPPPSLSPAALPKRKSRKTVAIVVIVTTVIAGIGAGIVRSLLLKKRHAPIESIAVMPFVNDSGNPDVEYLSDGMSEALIKSLSQLPNLTVKSRSSVVRYKDKEIDPKKIGNELGVQALLNGRVGQHGDQLSVRLELIDAETQNVIWTERYDRTRANLVTLQSDIARDVSSRIKTRLSGADEAKVTRTYTTNTEAYQLYLKGRYHWNKRTAEDIQKAIEHFKEAVEKDDQFALAYSGLADSYSILPYYVGSKSHELNQAAMPYAVRAVEIDDRLAEAHTSLAFVNEGAWNWADAQREYERALELNPNYSPALTRYARFEVRVPKRDVEGLARLKRALEVEPSSLVANDNLSQTYLAQGFVDLALDQAKRTVDLDPSYSFGLLDLAYVYVKKGQFIDAQITADKVVEVTKRASRGLVCLGVVNGAVGKRNEALSIVKELESRYHNGQADASEVAAVYAGLGDKDLAFAWLDKAFLDHSSILVDVRVEFPFASLHDDPRFNQLLKRMNMP